MHDYRLQAGYEAGHDKAWDEKWGDKWGDLTDEQIEAIEARTARCRGCHKKNCGECEV